MSVNRGQSLEMGTHCRVGSLGLFKGAHETLLSHSLQPAGSWVQLASDSEGARLL